MKNTMTKASELLSLLEDKETMTIKLKIGDTIKIGKWKNRSATIEGFETDEHNQPTVLTDKGEVNVLHFRLDKLTE